MASLQVQHIIFLFVSLFSLPACFGAVSELTADPNKLFKFTKVEVDPYPIKYHDIPIIKLTGVLSEKATDGTVSITCGTPYFYDDTVNGFSADYKFCDTTKCPVEPGPFVLTMPSPCRMSQHGELELMMIIQRLPAKWGYSEAFVYFKIRVSALPTFTNLPVPNRVDVKRVEIIPYKVTVKDNPVFRIIAHIPTKNFTSSTWLVTQMWLQEGLINPEISRRGYNLSDSTKGPLGVCKCLFSITIPNPYWRYMTKAGKYSVRVRLFDQSPILPRMDLSFEFPITET